MARFKAVFTDVDGTLFSHTANGVPESAQRAVQQARMAGIKVFAATGRHVLELRDLGFHMELDGWVTLNGCLCFNENGVYYENPIDQENIQILVSQLAINPFPCQFMEKDLMYINMDSLQVRQALGKINTPMPLILDPIRACSSKTYMLVPWVNEVTWNGVIAKMRGLKTTRWTPLAADVMPATAGKAKGVFETCRYYGIDPKETVAFGDGPNDIELFEACGISVAMGNSSDEVKRVADIVAEDIDADGFAKALASIS